VAAITPHLVARSYHKDAQFHLGIRSVEMKPKKNTGIAYEKKIAEIYKQILAIDGQGLKNVRVEHDIKLDSITTKKKDGTPLKRQIDVYWEFEVAV
jgi:hypothetical protein